MEESWLEERWVAAARRYQRRTGRLTAVELVSELQCLNELQRMIQSYPQQWSVVSRRVGSLVGWWLLQLALATAARASVRHGRQVLQAMPELPGYSDRLAYFDALTDEGHQGVSLGVA